MRADCDQVTGRGRDATTVRGDEIWIVDSPGIRCRHRAPDAKPGVVQVPGDEYAIARMPSNDILTIPDSETIRIPTRSQISFDRPLKAQPSRMSCGVLEAVLDNHALQVIRTELKPIDFQVVQDLAILEPVSIGISDHLRAFSQQNFLLG